MHNKSAHFLAYTKTLSVVVLPTYNAAEKKKALEKKEKKTKENHGEQSTKKGWELEGGNNNAELEIDNKRGNKTEWQDIKRDHFLFFSGKIKTRRKGSELPLLFPKVVMEKKKGKLGVR